MGSILSGIATPTEAASIGALGALIIALLQKKMTLKSMEIIAKESVFTTVMVFAILIGASLFSLVFRGYGGEEWIHEIFQHIPGGTQSKLLVVMLILFILGFFLDFIEITFVAIPIMTPVLFQLGVDPLWLGVLIALNLQTSFLTPPFGFALFYMRGVAPKSIETLEIYKGVLPFIGIQIAMIALVWMFPGMLLE